MAAGDGAPNLFLEIGLNRLRCILSEQAYGGGNSGASRPAARAATPQS